MINPKLDGICIVEEISLKDKQVCVKLKLEGIEEHVFEIQCSEILLANDGSSVTVGRFAANKPFLRNILDRFVAGRAFPVPEGSARLAVISAKKILGM